MKDGADALQGDGAGDPARGDEVLRQNAALFSALIAQAPMGTYVVDGQLRMREINAHAMPVFAGVQPLVGRELADVFDILWGPAVSQRCVAIFRHTLATGERYVSPAFTERRHDVGTEQSYEWEAQRVILPDGQHGVVCYFHETTSGVQAMAALRASEQRMRLATEATRVGIWEWNVGTNEIRWDAEMFRIYGIAPTPGGIVAYSDWTGAVVPEDLAVNEAILQDTVQRCGHSRRMFRIRRRDDGECRDVEAVETVRTGAQGQAEWVVGTNLDITERMRAEAEARRLTAEVAEASRRKDEFLATLAHELRNPLAPIRTGLQLLRTAPHRDETSERVCIMMERQLGHMVHLVDDLLDVSRISRGKLELRKQRLELAMALTSAVETSRPLIEAHHHELVLALPSQPIFVDADMTRLVQAFANLLNNAAKFTPEGGRISVSVAEDGHVVTVSVRDTGIGIPREMLPAVFELFTQVDQSLERSTSGLGIGLSLVKQLIELHGGSVEARSEGRGAGSEFVVRLPILPPGEPAIAPAGRDAASTTVPPRRVLVADDNVDAAESLAMMLELMGHLVRTAHDGQAAVEIASTFRPDVVLLDIGMPIMNGYDACRRIRDQPWGRDLVVVALTGWGQDEDKRRSQQAGFDHHIVKPVDLATIKRLVDPPTRV